MAGLVRIGAVLGAAALAAGCTSIVGHKCYLADEVILRKDIYEMMEDVTDMYRDAANIALRIVLKHT